MDDLETAVEKATQKRLGNTWCRRYDTGPRADLVAAGDGGLELAHKRIMRGRKYMNDLTPAEEAEVAAIYAEQTRRYYRAKLAREAESKAAMEAIEKAGHWPNGTPVPSVGDTVSRLYPGLFGMPFRVHGVVYRGKGGLRVRISPGQAVGGAKTVAIDQGWVR